MNSNLVIIPVFNEATTIKEVLYELCQKYHGDILIVDDGSTDDSIERIRACIEKRPITLISHKTNLGYGAALIDGFTYAIERRYQYAVTMDCDWQHQPQHVPELFIEVQGCDILSGSRYLQDFPEDTAAPIERRHVNMSITEKINALTSYNLTDSFCGFKAYCVASLKKLTLDEHGYGFPIQFWLQAFVHGLSVKEIAVARIYTDATRTFGAQLDDSAYRLKYYNQIIERERKRWNI
jgi:dolichol-phosphate mannosyltransferase